MLGAIRLPSLPGHLLDLRLGFALMRDRRVPWRSKLTAIVMGLAITGIVEFLEIPIEGVLAAVLPFLGIGGDAAIDGVELLAGPLLLAAGLLPIIAPRAVVDQIHAERSAGGGKVVDV